MPTPDFHPLIWREFSPEEMRNRAREFRDELRRRRTVREFSPRPVPREIIDACIMGAASAPSGANRQPWHFVAVGDPEVKRRIREAAEEEERAFYGGRAPDDWLEALAPFGTDASKPFLETAPWVIVIFAETVGVADDGSPRKNYYVTESVGIATGMLIASLHHAGLATLTHTLSPIKFVNGISGDRAERASWSWWRGSGGRAKVPANHEKEPETVRTILDAEAEWSADRVTEVPLPLVE